MTLAPNVRGILWSILSVSLFSVMTITVRFLSSDYSPEMLVFARTAITVALLGPWMLRKGISNVATKRFPLYLLRAATAYGGVLGWFYGVSHIPLADAVALHFTLPIFGVIVAIIVLHETITAPRLVALVLGFAGMLVILRPGFAAIEPVAFSVLGSAACYAVGNVTVTLLSRTEPPARIVFYLNIMVLPLAAIPAAFAWTTPGWADVPALLILGLSAMGAHLALAKAYGMAEASVLFPLEFLRLPIAALFGLMLFAEALSLWTMLGAGIIFAGTYYMSRREQMARH